MSGAGLVRHLVPATAYFWACIGCYSHVAIRPDNASQYQGEAVTVETKNGTVYELRPSWEIDTHGNVIGEGKIVTEGPPPRMPEMKYVKRYEDFSGLIPADSIAAMRFSELDIAGTAVTVLFISAPILFLVAWLAVPYGH